MSMPPPPRSNTWTAMVVVMALATSALALLLAFKTNNKGLPLRGPVPGAQVTARHMAASTSTDEEAYLRAMVQNHAEAVVAARNLARSGRPEMRALGARIVRVQEAEATRMRGFLRRWYAEPSVVTPMHPTMRDLSSATSPELDRLFLQDMVPHHMAAVLMSRRLLASGRVQHGEVRALATSIQSGQLREIRQMQHRWRQWFPGSLPSGD